MFEKIRPTVLSRKMAPVLASFMGRVTDKTESVVTLHPVAEGLMERLQKNLQTEQVRDLAWCTDEVYDGFKGLFELDELNRERLFQALCLKPQESILLLVSLLEVQNSEYEDIRALQPEAADFLKSFQEWVIEHPQLTTGALFRNVLSKISTSSEKTHKERLADEVEPYQFFLPIESARATARINSAFLRPALGEALVANFPGLESFNKHETALVLGFATLLDDFQLSRFKNFLRNKPQNNTWTEALSLAISNNDKIDLVLSVLVKGSLGSQSDEPGFVETMGGKLKELPKPSDGYEASEELTGVNLWERNAFVLRRLERVAESALKAKDLETAVEPLESKRFDRDVSMLVAVARSVAGGTAKSFEWHTPETDVDVFNGGKLVELGKFGGMRFLQESLFGEQEWKMINDSFEASYRDYPKWKEVLRQNLALDLNNPAAKFYFIKHKGRPIAVRKVVDLGDNNYHVGTFYVNEVYQGIGSTLEQWTLQDLPNDAKILGTVSPLNKALEGYTERGRVVTKVLKESAGDIESEDLLQVQTVGKSVYESSAFSREEVLTRGDSVLAVEWIKRLKKELGDCKVVTRVCFEDNRVYFVTEALASGNGTSELAALAA